MGLLLLVALVVAPSGEGVVDPVWTDLELPVGFELDLETGEVSNRLDPSTQGSLAFDGEELRFSGWLARLPQDTPQVGFLARPQVRIERGSGEALTEELESVSEGDELVFDLGERGWGYLRVLASGPVGLSLEYASVPAGLRMLERVPAMARTFGAGESLRIEWAAEAGAHYRVSRVLLSGAGSELEQLATVEGGSFLDEANLVGRLAEYHVARIPDAEGGPEFGCRVLGSAPLWSGEEPIDLARGQYINMLSGLGDSDLYDLKVEALSSSGAQLVAPPGVALQQLSSNSMGPWLAGPLNRATNNTPRLFISAGREALVRTAQGLHARVRIERDEGGSVFLYRQMDVAGGLVLPRTPQSPETSWTPEEGVVFQFRELGERGGIDVFGIELDPLPQLVVEREEPLGSELWEEIVCGAPGERKLVHPAGSELKPARYRFRHRWDERLDSPPGAALDVLVGDDGGEAVDSALGVALADLGAADFERRRRAQRLIELLGERAWPGLRQAIESDDPEVAGVAAALLGRGEASLPGSVLPPAVILRARADSEGVHTDPPEGWLDPNPIVRARALLAARPSTLDSGEDAQPERLSGWYRISAEADPDPGVRLLARMLGSGIEYARAPWRSGRLSSVGARSALSGTDPSEREQRRANRRHFFADQPDVSEATEMVVGELQSCGTRGALTILQVLWDLASCGDSAEAEQAAVDRAQIVLGLIDRYQESGENVLLEAADRLIDRPEIQPRAMHDLADLCLNRYLDDEASGRHQVELEEASLTRLKDRLRELYDLGERNVDLILPGGVYRDEDGSGQTLSIGIHGLRIVGRGAVVLEAAISLSEVEDFVLEGLQLVSPTSFAITATRSELLLRDCRIESSATQIQATDSVVEILRCEVGLPGGQRSYGVRTTGSSLLLARDCLIDCGASALSVSGVAFVEGCVLRSNARPCIEGPMARSVVLLDNYMVCEVSPLAKLQSALVDGIVIDSPANIAQGLAPGIQLCPGRIYVSGPAVDLAGHQGHLDCPLER